MPNLLKDLIQFSRRFFAGLDALARHRSLSIFVIGCLSFGGSWLWALFRGFPVPYVQDEYSYLLAGDTFAHGRVTNPTHPMWIHFETFFVLQHPTYMSMYPPAQGAFLAFGKVLFGHPVYGVWLSAGLMCAAICWMLYTWVSPRWALIGGIVAVLQFSVFTYWSQSYWGGAVAAMGGALVFGALPRIFKSQRIRDALWLGLGCAVLANSRPLEGFLVAIPIGCLVLPWKKSSDRHDFLLKKVVPVTTFVLFITVLGIGAYNKQITGNSKVFPHFFYDNTYESYPVFISQPLRPRPQFNHRIMDIEDKVTSGRYYFYKRTWEGFIKSMLAEGFRLLEFFFGYPLAIPSLAVLLPLFFHRRTAARFRLALLFFLGLFAAITYSILPHYFSPLTCLAVLLVTMGLRGLAWLKLRNARVGSVLVIFLIALQLLLNIVLTPIPSPVRSLARSIQSSPINLPASFTREELRNILMKQGGQYLVIVKYFPSHDYHNEWVHNDADIDHAPIVWARDMDEGHNKELLEYFKDRQVLFIYVYWDRHGYVFYDHRQ